MADDTPGGCHVCAMAQGDIDERIVFRDADWTVVTVADAPGVLMIFTNAHDAGLRSLSASAAASMGPMLARLSDGLVQAGEGDRAALIHLGDNSIHTHFVLVARSQGDPHIADLSALEQRIKASRDPGRTGRMKTHLRDMLVGA